MWNDFIVFWKINNSEKEVLHCSTFFGRIPPWKFDFQKEINNNE